MRSLINKFLNIFKKKVIILYYQDVGQLPPNKAQELCDRNRDIIKEGLKNRFLDPIIFVIPVRPPQKTKIEIFSGKNIKIPDLPERKMFDLTKDLKDKTFQYVSLMEISGKFDHNLFNDICNVVYNMMKREESILVNNENYFQEGVLLHLDLILAKKNNIDLDSKTLIEENLRGWKNRLLGI